MEFRADSTMRLDEAEADLLRRLTAEMETLLVTEGGESDAVMDRLFPDAYESPEDESAFREIVGDDLHKHKIDALTEVRKALGRRGGATIAFSEGDPGTWLTVLTDLRLAIGSKLGVTEETMSQDLDLDQPTNSSMLVLHWLGWMQESILQEIT
jgi:Domain of unknown function (DUF2017)